MQSPRSLSGGMNVVVGDGRRWVARMRRSAAPSAGGRRRPARHGHRSRRRLRPRSPPARRAPRRDPAGRARRSVARLRFYQCFGDRPLRSQSLPSTGCCTRTSTGPGRRLRRPVRPAHRPPGARAEGLLRDRPAPDHRRRGGRRPAGGADPVGRAEERPRRRARRRSTRRSTTSAIPILGICYGAQLIAQQLGGDGRPGDAWRVRAGQAHVADRPVDAAPTTLPASHDVWMSHFDAVTGCPTASSPRPRRPTPRSPRWRTHERRDLGRAVPPRGRPLAARHGRAAPLPARARRLRADVDDGVDHRRRRSPRCAPRSATAG